MKVNIKRTRWVTMHQWAVLGGLLLVMACSGMSPPWAYSRLPPLSSENQLTEAERFTPEGSNQSWSAFRSDNAKNVCVTVMNYGASEVFVHLFRKRSLTGAFTVLPQRISAMCSDVTVIEVECGNGTCFPQWYISDSD